MYVLEELWEGKIAPSERGYREGSPFAKMVRQVSESEEGFYKELSPEGRRAYEAYCERQGQLDDVKDCDSFIRGFRLGARMILDVVGDYNSPMLQVNEMGAAEE